jgi:mannose/cellobiose epimerase-like protein (N-acyl-D-glucosamine 2-epimerase family)
MDSTSITEQKASLLEFASNGALVALGGFGRLQADGSVSEKLGLETWINARMAYCFGLEVLAGNEKFRDKAELACHALTKMLKDKAHGGWVEAAGPEDISNPNKAGYAHAFVLLAASTLDAAKIAGAANLLRESIDVIEKHYWSEEEGACFESYNQDWSNLETYRGGNSNMHMVEAFMVCFDQTGDKKWLDRSIRITDRLLNVVARGNNWRLPEHYNSAWQPELDYNSDNKAHPFRPYGATVGHWFEWARLSIQMKWAFERIGEKAPSWLTEVAVSLYDQAIEDGWTRDGNPGFCYTVDWDGKPVVSLRLSWVICEAISASHVLALELNENYYETWAKNFWEYALENFPDPKFGNWHSELDEKNNPSKVVWADKPDIYHLFQSFEFSKQIKAVSLVSAITKKH